jgi:hypothetical protein
MTLPAFLLLLLLQVSFSLVDAGACPVNSAAINQLPQK